MIRAQNRPNRVPAPNSLNFDSLAYTAIPVASASITHALNDLRTTLTPTYASSAIDRHHPGSLSPRL